MTDREVMKRTFVTVPLWLSNFLITTSLTTLVLQINFGIEVSGKDAKELVSAALSHGINFFDTAETCTCDICHEFFFLSHLTVSSNVYCHHAYQSSLTTRSPMHY